MDYWITKLLHILLIYVSVYSQEVFNTMPPPVNTNFTCRGRDTGFYADVETNCRVYHTCDDYGNKFTYYCPEETAFRQEALVCDHAHLVDCTKGRSVSTFPEDNEKNKENNKSRLSHADSSLNEGRNAAGRSIDVFQSGNSNPSYTRSFRITAEPPPQFPTLKSLNRKQPTFILNSSVYLRDRMNLRKASPASQNNRVVTESSKNFEKIDKNEREVDTGGFSEKSSPTTSTTTFKPFRSDYENPTDVRFRYYDKKEENDEFPSRFSPSTSTTTFRPFGADFKVNSDNLMGPQPSTSDEKNEKRGFFGRSSIISTTTFKPFTMDFKVNPTRRTPSEFSFQNVNKKDESLDRFSIATLSTTFRPFGTDFKVHESSDGLPSFGNIKFDRGETNSGGRMPSGSFDHDEMNSRKGLQFEDKRRNGQKSEFGGSFGSEGRNSGGSSGFESTQKDTSSRNWQGFANNNERPSFFFDNSNFPYSETLRSMQAKTDKSSQSNLSTARPFVTRITSPPTTTAGTEFPVHPFTGSLSPLVPNELEDDPYYPKRPTTTEAYYKLSDRDKSGKRPFKFSTRRPWPGSLDFEIPEVLPDFNILDDLVDRRKLFFIPRVKTT